MYPAGGDVHPAAAVYGSVVSYAAGGDIHPAPAVYGGVVCCPAMYDYTATVNSSAVRNAAIDGLIANVNDCTVCNAATGNKHTPPRV